MWDTAIRSQYKAVQSATSSLAASISAEDQMVQSCPEASPMKWHQAHTTWFFETFVLRPFLTDYKPFREEFHWLFNSYYNSLGEEIREKSLRSVFSRPSLDEVLVFRTHIDQAMDRFLSIASLGRCAAQDGNKALMAPGFHKPGDVENRLGYYLGQIAR